MVVVHQAGIGFAIKGDQSNLPILDTTGGESDGICCSSFAGIENRAPIGVDGRDNGDRGINRVSAARGHRGGISCSIAGGDAGNQLLVAVAEQHGATHARNTEHTLAIHQGHRSGVRSRGRANDERDGYRVTHGHITAHSAGHGHGAPAFAEVHHVVSGHAVNRDEGRGRGGINHQHLAGAAAVVPGGVAGNHHHAVGAVGVDAETACGGVDSAGVDTPVSASGGGCVGGSGHSHRDCAA